MWQTGTSDNYKDLLDQLAQIATSNNMATAVVLAGGTGYVVDDELSVSGGTGTHTATVIVTSVSGGVVTGLRIANGGAYTVNPSTTPATTGGTGSGCTLTTTYAATGWSVQRETEEAVSATIAAGGTGYTVGDQLTLVGGLGVGTAPVFNVDTEAAGVVTAVSLVTAGDIEDTVANPVATTGGTGGGDCTLNVTYQPADQASVDKVLILEGVGAGSDEILVGIKTYTLLSENGIDTAYNWGLFGMVSFNSALRWYEQAGISPGFEGDDGDVSTTGGAYVTLKDSEADDMTFWISVTSRRIVCTVKMENATITHYPSFHLGFLNPFGTTTEQPYPIYIAGSSSRHNGHYADTEAGRSTGLVEMIRVTNFVGPGFYRKSDSVWQEVQNSTAADTGSPTRTPTRAYVIYPAGETDLNEFATNDKLAGQTGVDWDLIIPATGIPGAETYRLQPTPDTGGDLRYHVPATLLASDSPFLDIVGELDGVFWVSGVGLASEDTVTESDGTVLRVFQQGNRSQVFSFMAVKEE